MSVWNIILWIRIHWFELATLALLSLNLWFAFEVLSVLRIANQAMGFLANWVDRTRGESSRQGSPAETPEGGQSLPVLVNALHPLLITVALAALSWALLVALLIGIAATIWAVL